MSDPIIIKRPCRSCGLLTANTGQRCDTCKPQHNRKHNQQRAYYHTAEWNRLRAHVIQRDYQQCVACTSTHRLAVHHIIARNQGGADSPENLVTLCHHCHNRIEHGDHETQTIINAYMQQDQ